jgi:hypothetical protein
MTKPEYIAHLRSLGLCKDMAECMAGQARKFKIHKTASWAGVDFAWWDETEEGEDFWRGFYLAIRWADQQDERDLKGLK